MDWWKSAFTNTYADIFHRLFPEPTEQEVEQIVRWFPLSQYLRVLDLACGEGRHSILLAQRGYEVTGVDTSSDFLAHARARAVTLPRPPLFLEQDIRTLNLTTRFDLVLLIGNSFGYGTDEDQRRIVQTAARHLDESGTFLLSLPNGERSMAKFDAQGTVRKTFELDGEEIEVQEGYQFDTATSVKTSVWSIQKNGQRIYEQEARVRFYRKDEIIDLLMRVGLDTVQFFGNLTGDPFTQASPTIVIHAMKKAAEAFARRCQSHLR